MSAVGLWPSEAKRTGSSSSKRARAPGSQVNQRLPAIVRRASRTDAGLVNALIGSGD